MANGAACGAGDRDALELMENLQPGRVGLVTAGMQSQEAFDQRVRRHADWVLQALRASVS